MLFAGMGLILVAVALFVCDLLGYAIGAGETVNVLLFAGVILIAFGVLGASADGHSRRHRPQHG